MRNMWKMSLDMFLQSLCLFLSIVSSTKCGKLGLIRSCSQFLRFFDGLRQDRRDCCDCALHFEHIDHVEHADRISKYFEHFRPHFRTMQK